MKHRGREIKNYLDLLVYKPSLNLAFIVAVFVPFYPVTFVAYLLWIIYLVYGIKKTKAISIKIFYSVLIAYAVFIIVIGLASVLGLFTGNLIWRLDA